MEKIVNAILYLVLIVFFMLTITYLTSEVLRLLRMLGV